MVNYRRAAILFLGLFLILGYLCPTAGANPADEDIRREVAQIIADNYVDPVPSHVLVSPTVNEMLRRLGDPYAKYLSQEEYQEQLDSLDGHFTGIGIYLTMEIDGAHVLSVIKNSPADKVGLKKDDVIMSADGVSLAGMDSDQAMNLLRGPERSRIVLNIKRGEQMLTVNIIRKNVEVPTVHTEVLDEGTAYLVIDDFGQRTAGELEETVQDLQNRNINKWIVDLRGNPGGYLDTAIDIAGVFMRERPVVLVEERDLVDCYISGSSDVLIEEPVVLLQDEYSASAAEILAAALRDNLRALLIGKTTYGKGTVQQIFPLSNGDSLKLTIARFYSPVGEEINGVGIKPDIEVENGNILAAAELLLSDNRDMNHGNMVSLELERFTVAVDTKNVRQPRYWQAWGDITDGIGDYPVYFGNDDSGWIELSDREREYKWSYYYPGYEYIGDYNNIIAPAGFSIYIAPGLNKMNMNTDKIELVNAFSGEKTNLEIQKINDHLFNCKPDKTLLPGEYWLVISKYCYIATIQVP
jgi:carboxyl-terminal processing protease